jgi:hypothetical protein
LPQEGADCKKRASALTIFAILLIVFPQKQNIVQLLKNDPSKPFCAFKICEKLFVYVW